MINIKSKMFVVFVVIYLFKIWKKGDTFLIQKSGFMQANLKCIIDAFMVVIISTKAGNGIYVSESVNITTWFLYLFIETILSSMHKCVTFFFLKHKVKK